MFITVFSVYIRFRQIFAVSYCVSKIVLIDANAKPQCKLKDGDDAFFASLVLCSCFVDICHQQNHLLLLNIIIIISKVILMAIFSLKSKDVCPDLLLCTNL